MENLIYALPEAKESNIKTFHAYLSFTMCWDEHPLMDKQHLRHKRATRVSVGYNTYAPTHTLRPMGHHTHSFRLRFFSGLSVEPLSTSEQTETLVWPHIVQRIPDLSVCVYWCMSRQSNGCGSHTSLLSARQFSLLQLPSCGGGVRRRRDERWFLFFFLL